ncbi:glycosyltransferase [Streptacidiphilus sp. PB12-B1b]|nr:glycosyltransferase [Streptacidiphilus sp. PB12-B1b]
MIPARNEAARIALTVLAALRLPRVGPVVVVDDASTDSTARVAEESGARVVRLPTALGRAAAQRRGVAAVRETAGTGRCCLLFLDADLGASADQAAALVEPVLAGTADLALAVRPGAPERAGAATRRARAGIQRATGVLVTAPLTGELCLSAAAFAAASAGAAPVASGPGLIIDLLRQGYRVVEVPLELTHRPARRGVGAALRELRRYREVGREVAARGNSR